VIIQEEVVSGNKMPATPEEFERLLMSDPNSSFAWIQYMSYFLLAADMEAARRVAEKALTTINFREEEVHTTLICATSSSH
jgi:rRNA biogenesis protein RRP5